MTNRAMREFTKLNYLTIWLLPCFRRPCYHFYTSYLPSLQILRGQCKIYFWPFLNILSINMIHFRRASRALNRLFSKFDGFTLFSARFAQMISFSSLQIYNHCTFCGVLRAYFVNIFTLKLQNVYIPPFNFGF